MASYFFHLVMLGTPKSPVLTPSSLLSRPAAPLYVRTEETQGRRKTGDIHGTSTTKAVLCDAAATSSASPPPSTTPASASDTLVGDNAAAATAVRTGSEAEMVQQQLKEMLKEAMERGTEYYMRAQKSSRENEELKMELSEVREGLLQLRQRHDFELIVRKEAESQLEAAVAELRVLRAGMEHLRAQLAAESERMHALIVEKACAEERLMATMKQCRIETCEAKKNKLRLQQQLGDARKAMDALCRQLFQAEASRNSTEGGRVAAVAKMMVLEHRKGKAEAEQVELRERLSALENQLAALEQSAGQCASPDRVPCNSAHDSAESWDDVKFSQSCEDASAAEVEGEAAPTAGMSQSDESRPARSKCMSLEGTLAL